MNWYNLSIESQRTIARFLERSPEDFPLDSSLATMPLNEVKETLLLAEEELKDLTVLSLVSIFEQFLIEYLSELTDELSQKIDEPLSKETIEYACRNVERWYFKDILDLFKPIVGSQVVGDVKQIYNFRNWVAHGKNHKKKKKVTSVDPETAYERLSEFLNRLKLEVNNKQRTK